MEVNGCGTVSLASCLNVANVLGQDTTGILGFEPYFVDKVKVVQDLPMDKYCIV